MSCDASLARSDWLLERSFSKRLRASAQSFFRNGISARLKRAFQNFGSIRAASSKATSEAARIDPKFWNARFNLAEIPFLKKDWAEARKRFEQLLSTGQSDLAKEASQLIQYKILLTYLMEGKSNMVDCILAKLERSPDTPAVYYKKAAVAFQQKNEAEAKDWISAADKNYSPQLNKLFVESLYEVGGME